jgi:hypothetical protein
VATPAPQKKQPIPFGKYLLLDRINIGGMAEVWRGKTFGAGGFERLVAIKRILPNIAEDEEFITMFIDEAKITVQLTHANIAQIYELGHISNSYFIAMEYIAGKDMRAIFDRCRKKGEPAPVPLVCYLMSKACEGLDYAHRKKDGMGQDLSIVHRDISPQNILISYEGECKVIDFGIAKAAGKASKTQAGILKGKFGYMSPEQIRGLPLDRRSDVFAAGVCLYEMLTGERLFVGDSDFSVLEKVRKAEVLPPSTYNRRIPEPLEKICLKALAKDVDDRYQYANELADDLQRFLITSDSIFSRRDLMQYMKSTFAEEVEREKTRLAEYVDIKPPPGMLAAAEAGFGMGTMPPVPAPMAAQSAVTVAPTMVPPSAAPMLSPAGNPSRGGPPTLSPALGGPNAGPQAVRRSPSLSAIPKLSAAAPMLSNDPENENQSTMLVDRANYDMSSGPKPDPNFDEPGTDGVGIRTAPHLAVSPTGPTAKTAVPPSLSPAGGPIPMLSPSGPVSSPTLPAVTGPSSAPRRSPTMGATPMLAPEAATNPGLPAERGGGKGKVVVALVAFVLLALAGVAGLFFYLREPAMGLILVEIPADARGKARVNLNGDEIRDADGKPPREWPLLRKVRAGKVTVLITAEGFETFRQQVTIVEGQDVTTVTAKLERSTKSVQLVVVADPATAEVLVDNELVKGPGGSTSYVGEVAAGSEHQLTARAPGYKPYQRKLTAAETAVAVTVNAKLEPLQVPVLVSSEPSGATIFIGETNMGQTPNNLRVSFGVSEITLKKRCFDTLGVPVKIPVEPPKETITVVGKMTKQPDCK